MVGHDNLPPRFENLESRFLLSAWWSDLMNAFASAEPVEVGVLGRTTADGQVEGAGEKQFYKFTAAASGRMHIDLAADQSGLDPYLEVFHSSGWLYGVNDNASAETLDSSVTLYSVYAGDTYYIRASGVGETIGDFDLSITSDPTDDIGNTFEDAQELRFWSSWGSTSAYAGGTVNYAGDVDMMSFVASESGLVTVTQSGWGYWGIPGLAGKVTAYDADGNLLATSADDGGDASMEFRVVAGQRYYTGFGGVGDATGYYSASLLTIPEPFASAEVFDLGALDVATLSGTLAQAGQTKAYRFTAAAAGRVRIDLAADDGDLDPYLKLYRSPSWSWASMQNDDAASDTRDSSLLLHYVQPGDTYYVVVSGADDTAGAYTLTVTSEPFDDHTNTPENARTIGLWGTWAYGAGYGQINYAGDVDVMAFVAPDTGRAYVEQGTWWGSATSHALAVYDTDGNQLASDDAADDSQARVSFRVVSGQTYYVECGSVGNWTGSYRVQVNTVPEPFASAEMLDLGTLDVETVSGILAEAGETAGYQFTAAGAGQIRFNLAADGDTLDPSLKLYSSAGYCIGQNDNAAPDTRDSSLLLYYVQPGQTYYAVVSGADDTAGAYTLTVGSSPVDDMGNTLALAARTTLSAYTGGSTVWGQIGYAADVDVVSFVATQTGLMHIDQIPWGRLDTFAGRLTAYDADGNVLTHVDGDAGAAASLDFRVVRGQTYSVEIASAGDWTGWYRAQMTTVPEPFASAEVFDLGALDVQTLSGTLPQAGQTKAYRFTAAAAGQVRINLAADDGDLDPYLKLYRSPSWSWASMQNDNTASGTRDSSLLLYYVQPGDTYYLVASGADDTAGAYTLTVGSSPVDDMGNTLALAARTTLSAYTGGSAVWGQIGYADDVDVVSFVATQTGLMHVDHTPWGQLDTFASRLTAYDADGNILTHVDGDAGAAASLDFRVVSGRTYSVEIDAAGDWTGWYRAQMTTVPEPFASAEVFDLGALDVATLSGTLAQAGQTKAYRFTAAAAGQVRINLAADDGDLDPYLKLYRSPSWSWASMQNDNAASGTRDSSLLLYYVQPGDTYYLVASGADDTAGAYTLTVGSSPVDDMGNALALATRTTLDPNTGGAVHWGQIGYADDVDFISLVATQTGVMHIDQTPYGYNNGFSGKVTVYDADGAELAQDADASDAAATVSLSVTNGQAYYVAFEALDGATGWYRVQVTTEEAPPPGPDPVPPDGGEYTPGVVVLAHVLGEGAALDLIVVGTDGADRITLSQTSDSITLTTPLGATTYSGSFSTTVVYGFGGADTIRLSYTVTAASQVFGGTGDDQLFEAGSGEGWIYGQEGDDLLVTVGGSADRTWGGTGLDSFWTDGADTLEDVETAETLAASVHQITAFYQPTTNPAEHVSLEIQGQDIVDPAASSAYYNHSYRPLFVDEPEYNDIRQGAVGDCYFLASLASLADTDPGIIQQMIAPMGDGTYAVRYYRSGQPVYVRVDAELPGTSISPRYAKFTPDGELWVALAEKAYAQFRRGENSYASISGGWMDAVYREVTNAATTRLWPASSAVATSMADHLAAGHALTLASYSYPPGPIVGLHAYMVKSVEIDGGATLVTVYNPWGFDGRLYDGNSGDGLLTLTLATFRENFSAVVVSLA